MPLFNSELFKSNPKLLKGNLQIIACAGSGKTEFVSERILKPYDSMASLSHIKLKKCLI